MTSDDPELERVREALASLSEGARPGADCPDPERLWLACRGELPPEATRAIVDHLAACPACFEAWRLAHDLQRHLAPASERPVARVGSWRGARWALLAAGLGAVALLSVVLRWPPPDPEYRQGGAPVIRSLVPEGAALARSRCRLLWSPGPPGSRYNVQVAAEDLRLLAQARQLDAPEYLVPESSLEGLGPGATLLWQVEAILPGGERRTSPTFVLKLE